MTVATNSVVPAPGWNAPLIIPRDPGEPVDFDLLAAAQAADDLNSRARAFEGVVANLNRDETLTPAGKAQRAAEQGGGELLKRIDAARSKFSEVATAARASVAKLSALPAPATEDRPEQLAVAQVFAGLDREERAQAFGRALLGFDPELRRALLHTHPLVTRLGPVQLDLLREAELESLGRTTEIGRTEYRITSLERFDADLVRLARAIESIVDREALVRLGIRLARLIDRPESERLSFIREHGLEAFKQRTASDLGVL